MGLSPPQAPAPPQQGSQSIITTVEPVRPNIYPVPQTTNLRISKQLHI
jgi:hypothetical protein